MTESELCHRLCQCHVNDVSIFIDESFQKKISSLEKMMHSLTNEDLNVIEMKRDS